MAKQIAVITIGGTFFMKGTARAPGEVKLPQLGLQKPRGAPEKDKSRVNANEAEIEHHPLFNIDSSQIRAHHLNKLGEKICELSNNPRINAIVVLSGTDKMHRIVTRLAHHLHNLNTPVIFTGAQVPISEQGTDAKRNYQYAVRAAIDLSDLHLNQVLLAFGRGPQKLGAEVHYALNTFKADATSPDAFNHPLKRLVATVTPYTGTATTALGKQFLERKAAREVAKRRIKRRAESSTTTVEIGKRLLRQKRRKTQFTHIKYNLLQVVEVPETKSVRRIALSKRAQAITIRASGKGHVVKRVLQQIAARAEQRPIMITSEADAHVDLTAYKAGKDALQAGMLPSGGLITTSAEIRLEYLAHQLQEIGKWAKSNCPPNMDANEFKRKLIATLYLSGARFKGRETLKKHEEELGIKIPQKDVLINRPIEEALKIARDSTFKQATHHQPKQRRLETAPQNIMRPDRKSQPTIP